jgi:ribosomal protein L29
MEKKMSSHYKQINGVNYSASLLAKAEELVAGQGDGRISIEDAEQLLLLLGSDGKYTSLEKRSLSYIRDNFKFTEQGDLFLRRQIRSWAAIRGHMNSTKSASAKSTRPEVSDKELIHAELQLDRDMVNLRFAKQMGTLKETHKFKEIRREIARLRTEQVARENARGLAKNSLKDLHKGTFEARVDEKVTAEGSFASELNEQMEEE